MEGAPGACFISFFSGEQSSSCSCAILAQIHNERKKYVSNPFAFGFFSLFSSSLSSFCVDPYTPKAAMETAARVKAEEAAEALLAELAAEDAKQERDQEAKKKKRKKKKDKTKVTGPAAAAAGGGARRGHPFFTSSSFFSSFASPSLPWPSYCHRRRHGWGGLCKG